MPEFMYVKFAHFSQIYAFYNLEEINTVDSRFFYLKTPLSFNKYKMYI